MNLPPVRTRKGCYGPQGVKFSQESGCDAFLHRQT